jgi:hypothetical protein
LVPLYLFMLVPLWIPIVAVAGSHLFGAVSLVSGLPAAGSRDKA